MVNYAESNSDLAILAINTLQKAHGPEKNMDHLVCHGWELPVYKLMNFAKTTGREFGAWFYGMCLNCEMLHVQTWKVEKTGFRPHKGGNHVTLFCSSSANSDGWRS